MDKEARIGAVGQQRKRLTRPPAEGCISSLAVEIDRRGIAMSGGIIATKNQASEHGSHWSNRVVP